MEWHHKNFFLGKPRNQIWIGDEQGIITPPVMKALLSYQESILRSRNLIFKGTGNLQSLSDDDRETYEIRVKVSEGSSVLDIDLQKISEQFISEVLGKMPPEHIVVLGLGALLIWSSQSIFRVWLDKRRDVALEKAETDRQRAILEAQQFSQQADLEKFKILAEAMKRVPELGDIEGYSTDARHNLVKAMRKVDRAEIAGVEIQPEVARGLTVVPHSKDEPGRLDAVFEILRVDTTVEDGFRVHLRNIENGETFGASVRDVMLSDRDRELIRIGEWEKLPIEAKVNITRRDGRISGAIVENVIRVVREIPKHDGEAQP